MAALAGRARGTRLVLSPHGSLGSWGLAQGTWKKRLYSRFLARPSLGPRTAIHLSSRLEGEQLPATFRALPGRQLPLALNIDAWASVPELSGPIEGPLEVLMVGRIHPVKGFDLALEALDQATRRGGDLHLRVAGPDEGAHRQELDGQLKARNLSARWEWLGALSHPELWAALGRAHLLLAPSRQEAFGLGVAEAMAAGRPVLVSDRVGLADDVETARAGLVVDLDGGAIAQALVELQGDPNRLRSWGRAGRRWAQESFAPARVAEQFIGLYRSQTP